MSDLVARWVPRPFVPLGTGGFGRSDTREALRRFFEVDAEHVVVATLGAPANEGRIKPVVVRQAIEKFAVLPDAGEPLER